MCVLCANEAVGGRWRPITWPTLLGMIEAELAVRPVRNQHWFPGETLQALRVENARHGLVVTR